ncbi:hypothetical protein V6Z11_A05G056000 [Gossypium hirsutum]
MTYRWQLHSAGWSPFGSNFIDAKPTRVEFGG